MADKKYQGHIQLTSHPDADSMPTPIRWGAPSALERGPLIATLTNRLQRNVIGTHSGAYAIYRALAVTAGQLTSEHKADLTNTAPAVAIGPHASWFDPKKIVSIDPFGATAPQVFSSFVDKGFDIRPTIAVTKAHINLPEIQEAIEKGRLVPDGKLINDAGDVTVTKVAIEPVWYLPGIAERFNVSVPDLRRGLFENTGGMFPELITRSDLDVFLPPIGGATIYFFGDPADCARPEVTLAARVHDECNGSDVFGSDICTCRPYLVHGIELCIETAQKGGAGVIVYNRKEGRALGEVTKFLVYNARKRQVGGDSAATYFHRTECVAGVQDMRFQELMPDALHWLGIAKIDLFASMSDMKHDAITASGITIKKRIPIPEDRIPKDARVEMEAKKAAGYYTEGATLPTADLEQVKGRNLDA